MRGICQLLARCPQPQVLMNTLVNHDLKAHWELVVKIWGNVAANCSDFEAAHKWALKQFVKLVPHGKYFEEHLATRHLTQFAFCHGREDQPPKKEPKRFCHCGGRPCPHKIHVHVEMPGLQKEDKHGRLFPLPGRISKARRSVRVVEVETQRSSFRRALQVLMATVNGTSMASTVLPEHVFRCSRMHLKWHGKDGEVEYQVAGWACSHMLGICFPAVGRGGFFAARICFAYADCSSAWRRAWGGCPRGGFLPVTHMLRICGL